MRPCKLKRLAFLAILAGGTLMQTTCSQIVAQGVGGITASIANEYLRSIISDWLNISTGFPFSL
ncbi:MAG TPA: hypothetical protein VLM89_04940 [Phycisphaerae bacterium]|nr:hypothetical protein [Phycisphaerae bacterium]